MSLATKLTKAKKLGITFAKDYVPKEAELDAMIEAKTDIAGQEKEEAGIKRKQEKAAADEAMKNQVILKDVDGDDVDQSDYFYPRTMDEKISDKETLKATDQTAPLYFNKSIGYPVDRDELIEVFLRFFPRKKEFLFYKKRESEVYLVIVPLKYAKTISASNESRPGDFQRHAMSFIGEGSVNVDSLSLKLERIAKHSSISTEELA